MHFNSLLFIDLAQPTNQPADALSRKPVSVVSISSTWDKNLLAQAQRSDPVLSNIISQLESQQSPKRVNQWLKFPHRRYLQLWSQLTLCDSVLYRKVKSPLMQQHQLLIVVPTCLRKQFLQIAHDQAGHQGSDRTLARLSELAYWVGMEKMLGITVTTAPHVKSLRHHPTKLLLFSQL